MATEVKVGARELKAHLGRYLRIVREGGTVIVTERGKSVGQIMPYTETTEEEIIGRAKAAVRAGQAIWNGERLRPRRPVVKPIGGKMVSDLIAEDRDSYMDDLMHAAFGPQD